MGKGRASRLNAHYKLDAPMIAKAPYIPNSSPNPVSRTRPLSFEYNVPLQNLVDQQSLDVMKLNRRFLNNGEDSLTHKELRKVTNETLLETLEFSPTKQKSFDGLDTIDDVELEYFK
jgi:hypothetical protein